MKFLVHIIALAPCILNAEIVKEFIDKDTRYFFDWISPPPPAQAKSIDDYKGTLSLYAQNKDGGQKLIFSEKKNASYKSPNSRGEPGRLDLIALGNDIYYTTVSSSLDIRFFHLTYTDDTVVKKEIPWAFAGGMLQNSNCKFTVINGQPALVVAHDWMWPQDSKHEFILQKDGLWLEVSDGINEIFVCPEDGLEWDFWLAENIKKRNELRKRKDPNAVLYKMPQTKSPLGFLLDRPDKIDEMLAQYAITQADADRVKAILRKREQRKGQVQPIHKEDKVKFPTPPEKSHFPWNYVWLAIGILLIGRVIFIFSASYKKKRK